jgi:hypothetical protein
VAFVISKHPELVNLAHDEARHFSEPLILMFRTGFLVSCVDDRGGENKGLMSDLLFLAPVPSEQWHPADGGLGLHNDGKLVVLRNDPSIEEPFEHCH